MILRERLLKGENLLIIEVDGPKNPEYYKEKYGENDLIQNDTMLITEHNIKIMINDPKYSFGHGYCLACALMGKEEWMLGVYSKYQQLFKKKV